jgi:putative transposase
VPRIHAELADDYDIHVGKKRVERLMRAAGLRGVSRRRFVRTTVADIYADLPSPERARSSDDSPSPNRQLCASTHPARSPGTKSPPMSGRR